MKDKEKNNGLKTFFNLLYLIAKIHPITIFWMFLSGLVRSLNIVINIYIPKYLIDYVSGSIKNNNFYMYILGLLILKFTIYYLNEYLELKVKHEKTIFTLKLNAYFSNKVNNLKYKYIESPDVLELKEAAKAPIEYGTMHTILLDITEIISAIFTISAIIFILLKFSFILFIIVTCLSIFSMLVEARLTKASFELQKELVPINMKHNYYAKQFFDDNRQKEFRVYRNNDVLIEKLSELNQETLNKLYDVQVLEANSKSISGIFNILGRFLIYTYAALRVLGILGEKISLGNFSALVLSIESYGESLRKFGINIYEISGSISVIEPIFEFLDLDEMENDSIKKPGKLQVLEFKNVSFSYPKTNRKILNNISFKIENGEKLALVGRNNSGKSTIVKLICRLFDPSEGQILWNGIDIKEFSYKEYMMELSTVFQDFKLFPISIWENVSTQIDSNLDEDKIKENVYKILKEVNLDEKIDGLENGVETKLDKILYKDATELSGGEKQKLAIARAVFKDSSLAILDEPTAALDPLAEAEVYEHFDRLVKGKTALFISHRMSASRFCDRILVLEEGKITGNGSHKELIKENELYRTLYEAQAQYYK